MTNFIDDVKPYARARMADLFSQLKRRGHTDGFNFENIPATELNRVYHVELLEAEGVVNNQDHQTTRQPFVVRIFKSATLNPKGLIDDVAAEAKTVVREFLKPTNRLTQAAIKNIFFERVLIEKLAASNDNAVIGRISFVALVITDTRQ